MTNRHEQATRELSRGGACPKCGGSLALFAESDAYGAGEELRCLMCAKVVHSTSVMQAYETDGETADPTTTDIRITRHAAKFLGDLLAASGVDDGRAFRLEKNSAGAHVSISKKQNGDITLLVGKTPLLILSSRAARDLDGSTLAIEREGGRERITVTSHRHEEAARELVKQTA